MEVSVACPPTALAPATHCGPRARARLHATFTQCCSTTARTAPRHEADTMPVTTHTHACCTDAATLTVPHHHHMPHLTHALTIPATHTRARAGTPATCPSTHSTHTGCTQASQPPLCLLPESFQAKPLRVHTCVIRLPACTENSLNTRTHARDSRVPVMSM